jgi:FkbM family methyltransferase
MTRLAESLQELLSRLPALERASQPLIFAYLEILRRAAVERDGTLRSCQIEGSTLKLDLSELHDFIVYRSLLREGYYEYPTSKLLLDIVRPQTTFVDVGASEGYYSILLLGALRRSGRILAIEPGSAAFDHLRENVVTNEAGSVITAIHGAASDCEGQAWLVSPYSDSGQAHLSSEQLGASSQVKTFRIDSLGITLDRFSVVKIDTEGSEPSVLKGMSRFTSSSSQPNIVFEWNPRYSGQSLWNAIPQDYAVYQIGRGKRGYALREVKSYSEAAKLPCCNLYCVGSSTDVLTDAAATQDS